MDAHAKRIAMVDEQVAARGITDEGVLSAMRTVPRHEFVPEDLAERAYEDRPLPIGHGQTISQPYIVALMTELCQLRGSESVLEVGTGSGFQAAVLAEVAARVYTVEIVEPLLRLAAERLRRLRYDNVFTRFGDGGYGWVDAAPFDAIVVTAAPGHVPQALLDQLAEGGRLVAPVGGEHQNLEIVTRRKGKFERRRGTAVRFVPLTGSAAQ